MRQRIYRRIFIMLQLALLFTSTAVIVGGPVFAFTTNDVTCSYYKTCGYDPTDENQSCTPVASTATLAGSDSAEKAWNYLTGKGLSGEQAAGVIGNLIAESSLDPEADNGSHRGIAQWDTGGRWARFVEWAGSQGLETNSFDAQIQYVWKEATTRGNIEGIKKYDDVPHTTWYWGRYFEVAIIDGSSSEEPLTNVQDLDRRTVAAQQQFTKFGGTSGSAVSDAASGSSGDCGSTSDGVSATAACTNVDSAPPNDFQIVTFPGTTQKTDKRTLFMVNVANDCLKKIGEPAIRVVQGSYCGSSCAAASGSSHDKGATIDISTRDRGGIEKVYKLLKVLREVGFAAWYRDGGDNPSFAGNEHIHAVALGAPLTGPNAPGSTDQLILYCTGGDGLHGGQKDRQLAIVGRPLPDWALHVKPECTRYP
ncbi:hypothetical protein BH09PAT4_BH09PAT4_03260 [soil metagenome]